MTKVTGKWYKFGSNVHIQIGGKNYICTTTGSSIDGYEDIDNDGKLAKTTDKFLGTSDLKYSYGYEFIEKIEGKFQGAFEADTSSGEAKWTSGAKSFGTSKNAGFWFKQLNTTNTTEVSSVSAYDKYYSALTSGDAALTSKTINWKTFSDFSSVDSSFYSALEWGSVNISNLQKFQSSAIDWNQVQYSEFSSTQYKQTNWSQVSVSSFTSEQYQAIDWGQVNYRGSKSISYSEISWSQVDFGDFSIQTFKKVDWSKVQTADLTAEQYSDINWSQVKFKGSTAPSLSSLDLSLVINASSFSQQAAKQIDWTQVSADDLSASALSKLSGLGVKKKGVNVAELLKPGTQAKELSFAGVGQAQAGALTTGLEDSGSGAQVLLAAVEKQPVLV